MKPKLTIVSSDDIILYQPTILNLYNFLQAEFDVTIITFEPEYLGRKRDSEKKIIYISYNKGWRKFYRLPDLLINAVAKRTDKYLFKFKFRSLLLRKYTQRLIEKELRKIKSSLFIAVDPMPLYAVQRIKGAAHFLSLEIIPNDPFLKKINRGLISSVIIQNEMRYDYLFHNSSIKTFYIQNAPMLKYLQEQKGKRSGFIWAGTVVKNFGVFDCFEFIRAYPEFRLVCKGGVEKNTGEAIGQQYKDLLDSGNLTINNEYLSTEQFILFLSTFRIGFCFYSWELIRSNINYETVPSGKMFMYLAAGVPVIASRVSGFRFVEEFGAGVLVDDYSPITLFEAVKKIEADFETYSRNAHRAFKENCFDKNAGKFKDFILSLTD